MGEIRPSDISNGLQLALSLCQPQHWGHPRRKMVNVFNIDDESIPTHHRYRSADQPSGVRSFQVWETLENQQYDRGHTREGNILLLCFLR
jgi:hypothetical protein